MTRALLLTITAALALAGPAGADLRVAEGGRWFEDGGEPVALFGSGLWTIIPDVSIDIEEHNAWYAGYGANANRAALFSFFNAVAEGQGLGPWRRTGPGTANDGGLRFDLTKPNDAFWERARAYFASCERHGIYVWLQIFGEPYVEGSEQRWYINPFNPDNNINDIPDLPGGAGSGEEAFYNPDNEALMAIQDALVARLLDETAGRFGNIVYEIGNEINQDSVTSKAEEWQQHWVDFFQAYEKERDVSLLLSNNTRRSLFDAAADGFDVVNHYGFAPLHVRGSEPAQLARDVAARVWTDFAAYSKPIVNSRPCSDPDRTEYPDIVSPDEGRRLFWSYFMSGGHIIGFRTTAESWKGGTAVEEILKNLRAFIDEVPLADMAPSRELAGGGALCLAAPGACYAVYLPDGGKTTLHAPEQTGQGVLRWYDPRAGAWGESMNVSTGDLVLEAPGPGDWAALIKTAAAH